MKPWKINRASLRRVTSATTLSLSLLGSVSAIAQSPNTTGRIPAPVFSKARIPLPVLDTPGRNAVLPHIDHPVALDPIVVARHPIHLSSKATMARNLTGPTVTLTGHIPAKARTATKMARLAPRREITLNLMLRPRNQALLDDVARRLYDPKDSMFHQFLTPSQRIANFSPTQEDFNTVVAFAQQNGLRVTDSSVDRQIVKATGTVAQIETALKLHLNQYQAADGSSFYAPDAEPQVPAAVASLLFGMENLTDAARPYSNAINRSSLPPKPNRVTKHAPTGDASAQDTPDDIGIYALPGMPAGEIKKVFNIAYSVNGAPLTGGGQHVALVELGGFDQSDINYYIWYNAYVGSPSAYLNYTPIQTHLMAGYNGSTNSDTGEVELDIEMLEAVADGLAQIDVYEEDANGSIADELNQILNDDTANQVSISYGYDEDQGAGALYESDFNAVAELLSLQGQAVFVSSGDHGAYGTTGQALTVNGFAASPWVTGVGGTTIWINEFSDYGAFWYEHTWNDGGASGGGISANMAIPLYQYDYLANDGYLGEAGASLTNRNVPDVALDADPYTGYYTHIQGNDQETGGTSAAAPIWAGFWAQLNQYRTMFGGSIMGFANPALYWIAQGSNYNNDFRDVYGGSNNNYYYDTYGYDCTTGLGTLNAINMISDLVNDSSNSSTEYFYIQQPEITSGQQLTMGVDLSVPAPTYGRGTTTVTYAILNGNYLYSVGQHTLPPGATSDSINVIAPDVKTVTTEQYICSVTYRDAQGKVIGGSLWSNYYGVEVLPNGVKAVSITPSVTYDALGATGTVALGTIAAQNELIDLTSSAPTNASVPSTVTVAQGKSSVTFPIATRQVTMSEQVTITAKQDASSGLGAFQASGEFTISPLVSSVSIAPSSVTGGSNSIGTITLGHSTPSNLTLTLKSSVAAVSVPATVMVPAGKSSTTFPIDTSAVAATTTATVTVADGNAVKTATLKVLAATLQSLSLKETSATGPTTVTGTVTLTGKAATKGLPLTLISSNPSVASAPASLTVASGATTAQFGISVARVTKATTVTIKVTDPATGIVKTSNVTVNP